MVNNILEQKCMPSDMLRFGLYLLCRTFSRVCTRGCNFKLRIILRNQSGVIVAEIFHASIIRFFTFSDE